MRPPSYYTSIVQRNDRDSGRYGGSSGSYSSVANSDLTTRQQLRSSLSSSSSSSYVSRSHLPYVPQSTLVAHCFTGVGSSTRPYGNSSPPNSSTSYISSSLISTRSPSFTSSTHQRPCSTNSSYIRPKSSNPYLSSRSSGYSSSSSTSSSYLPPRSPYLNSSTSNKSTPTIRYRPTPSSSYYKPIKLRERPSLAQLSSRPASTCPESDRNPSEDHSKADEVKSDAETIECPAGAETKLEDNNSLQYESVWSHDVARNISRNKYLIKFREIEKPNRPGPGLSVESEESSNENHHTPESNCKGVANESAEDMRITTFKDIESGTISQTEVDPIVTNVAGKTPTRQDTEPSSSSPIKTSCDTSPKKLKKIKKKASTTPKETMIAGKEVDVGQLVGPVEHDQSQASKQSCDQITAHQAAQAESGTLVKKERKNVKLKLKPIGAKHQTGKANAVAIAEHMTKENATRRSFDSSSQLSEPAKRPIKVEKLIKKPSEDVRRTEKPTNKSEETKADSSNADNKENLIREPKDLRKKSSGGEKLRVDTAKVSSMLNKIKSPEESPQSAGGGTKSSRLRFRQYNYDDFNFLNVLGHGGWGFVILAELKDYDACFAVKCIKKITIVEDDDYDSIMIERKVLALGNVNPFICKLFCTFETDGFLFFVMEYCAGGDLMFHVQREGKFTESRSRFYAAEIICAIRFLHNRHIIYRDLKLDNILLDARGHIRLVDFGMCQCRTYREEMLPSNFCGTPEYISPEIIKGVPYNHSVDWWSFGVLLYEMAVGKMPFRGNDENELLWNVCYEQIHYPMFLSKELTELLKLLLEREPSKRMGMATCKSGDIYDQPYFRGVDWKAVEELEVEPPFVPEVTSKRDVQNFDSDFTESACELSPVDDETLGKIDQNQFEKFPYTNPDIYIFEHSSNKCSWLALLTEIGNNRV